MVTQDNFKEMVLEFRRKNQMTQEKLAERSGVSRLTIIKIENGKLEKLNAMTLYKLDRYFKIYETEKQ